MECVELFSVCGESFSKGQKVLCGWSVMCRFTVFLFGLFV